MIAISCRVQSIVLRSALLGQSCLTTAWGHVEGIAGCRWGAYMLPGSLLHALVPNVGCWQEPARTSHVLDSIPRVRRLLSGMYPLCLAESLLNNCDWFRRAACVFPELSWFVSDVYGYLLPYMIGHGTSELSFSNSYC